MSSCGCSSSSTLCQTVYPVLSPCACDDAAPIRVEGPDGQDGPKGATPIFSIGTVTGGNAAVTVVETDEFNRVINWVLPAVPEGEPYTWTAVNTFEQPSVFELGLVTTGGTSTFGGTQFNVIPDATFSADLEVGGTVGAFGDSTVTGATTVDGNASTDPSGGATFTNVTIASYLDLTQSGWVINDVTAYNSGLLTINSCVHPENQLNVRNGVFVKAEPGGLTPVAPVATGVIAATVVVNVPISSCMPQANPIVDITFRVSYQWGGAPGPFFNFNATLWQGMVGGTALDFYTQGDPLTFNSWYGTFELRARAVLSVGNNNFLVEVQNNDVANSFTPIQATFWLEG